MPVYVPGGVQVIPIEAIIDLSTSITNLTSLPSVEVVEPSRFSAIDDVGKYLRFTAVSTQTYTVEPTSTVAWPTDCEIHGRNAGIGDLTIVPGVGVTINAPYLDTLVIPLGGTFTLKRVGDTDEWDVFGQTVAA